MSCIVYLKNKKTGVVYAYESESYRDPVTKKPKSKRTYLGRVDPVTKMIIPKAEDGKRNRAKSAGAYGMLPDETVQEINDLKKQIKQANEQIIQLQAQVDELTITDQKKTELISQMSLLLKPYL